MCKWLKDEVCVNSDCPAVADFCPVVNHPGVCRYEETDENKIECWQCQHLMFSDTEKELAKNAKREYARKWRAENRDKVKAANERYWLRRAGKTMAAADEPEKVAMEKGDKWK